MPKLLNIRSPEEQKLAEIIIQKLANLVIPKSSYKLQDFNYTFSLLELSRARLNFDIILPFPVSYVEKDWEEQINAALMGVITQEINFKLKCIVEQKKAQDTVRTIPNVKNIITVASGKGGVGKSTVSANLAIELQKFGAKVGLLDADLYGPSQTLMMGVHQQKAIQQDGKFIPLLSPKHQIELMSMGLLINETQAVIWRGPMISQALQQLLFLTRWGELDYLIIDLPPGTGDIQLTISQKVPVTGALIVTTPQDIALIDAKKAIDMFEKVNIPVLGLVENMAYYCCPECYYQDFIFGTAGAEKLAQSTKVEVLEHIPLTTAIREAMDRGQEGLLPNQAIFYQTIAWKLVLKLALLTKDYSHRFPEIVVEKQ